MGSTAFFSIFTSHMNKTFKLWVSLCSYHVLMRQNCQETQEAFIRSAFLSEIRPPLHSRGLFRVISFSRKTATKKNLSRVEGCSVPLSFCAISVAYQRNKKSLDVGHLNPSISLILFYFRHIGLFFWRLPVSCISAFYRASFSYIRSRTNDSGKGCMI